MQKLLFAHVIIILPDKRILLRRLQHKNGTTSRWSATIERIISNEDNPKDIITEAISNTLSLSLFKDTTIRSFSSINITEHNRTIFPFVVNINETLTLKSSISHQFLAKTFTDLSNDLINNTIYCDNSSESEHTVNSVYVLKEAHIKGILTYA